LIIATIGDSITAGTPLWDPDPGVRASIAKPDERSQWQWWAAQTRPQLDFRNHGVNGERTDQIAARLNDALNGAEALVVQGGINDIVQRRSVDDAARNLGDMAERAQQLGFRVALVDVLPWNNGDARAAEDIVRLNELVRAIAERLGVHLFPFHATLTDPEQPHRMRDEWTDDGNHPSVEGHRLLGESAFKQP
jgi:lysophospholipase L1-like esterase